MKLFEGMSTPAQIRAIYLVGRDCLNLNEREIDEKSSLLFGGSPAELTKQQASDFIRTLSGAAK